MDYLDIERITRPGMPQAAAEHARLLGIAANAVRDGGAAGAHVREGVGYRLRQYDGHLVDVSIAGEKRVELEVATGGRALLYVLSGGGRLEGDDTAIGEDDVVWFKPADGSDCRVIGIEADTALRALVFAPRPSPGASAPPL